MVTQNVEALMNETHLNKTPRTPKDIKEASF